MKKLNEECFEFLEAVDNYEDFLIMLKKDEHSGELKLARDFVIEEMADILLLLTQFIARYDIKKEEVDEYMDLKLERTLERIKDGYYKEENGEK